MASDGTNGLKTVLALLRGEKLTAEDGVLAQPGLFADEGDDLPSPLGPSRSGRGRPVGARNKSTDEWLKLFLARHKSPMMVLGELYSRPLAELYAELLALAEATGNTKVSINPLDVLRLQRDAAAALLEYVHKKQPKEVVVSQKQRGVVLFSDLEDVAADGSDAAELPVWRGEVDQGVSEPGRDQSDEAWSDAAEKTSDIKQLDSN